MKYKNIDYDVIGSGIPVLIIHGWGISKITIRSHGKIHQFNLLCRRKSRP